MKMRKHPRWIAATMLALSASSAWAQHDAHGGSTPPAAATTEPMNHESMPGMDHSPQPATPKESQAMPGMDHGGHTMKQPEAASTEPRDPHAYAGGYDFNQFPMRHEGGDVQFGTVRVDRLEHVHTRDRITTAYEVQAAYGGDINRVVVKAEGDVDSGKLEDAGTELLWRHAATAFWNTELGVRYDSGEDPDRGWLALGLQGMAPYWFEVDATAYIGDAGRTALNVEVEYELLLTQKLILQPRVSAVIYGKDDAERGLGAGLSDVAAGMRLRYEFRREFAPYIGIEWGGKFGGTKDEARAAGMETQETRAVAGLRFWF